VLEEICEGDAMHLELMAKLLDTERQYRKMSRRVGIYEALEKCFATSSRSPEEAIKNAHLKRDLKTAVSEGDVARVKQLTLGDVEATDAVTDVTDELPVIDTDKPPTWASMKFNNKDLEDPGE
jgi:DNA sulfur modification protein DndC